ncbi:lipoprotein [Klebsiella aerogenes]|nr:lipoprotein [Klebsiella aerogenes]
MNYRLSALALGATLLVGCASSSSGDRPQGRSDPLEGFNRTMFNFNFNVVDPYVLRPVAVAWRDLRPTAGAQRVKQFYQ